MINAQYKLIKPLTVETCYEDISLYKSNNIIIKPTYLSICKADLRYYLGQRSSKILKKRLPLSLIHEAVGIVISDTSKTYKKNQRVVMLPNISGISDVYLENYRLDSIFKSSKADGFMQEMICLPPKQVLPYQDIEDEIAALSEFISVGVHAVESFLKVSNINKEKIAIWGDGALGYVVASLLKIYLPNSHITVIGIDTTKLEVFSFADKVMTVDEIASECQFDHAFECVGGQASGNAINQIIDTINPQGTITILGVSEEPVPILTRMVLEKGLIILGRSRSTRADFIKTIELLENDSEFRGRCSRLISETIEINNISDIHKAFSYSINANFKTILKWNL